ncbi:MAG: PspC domain-containing protein [Hyphomonadaceae bacterium]|nr:PspC domain-containing protein [Hyphomonadaceae bacterium]MBC6413057.1 PspC domain-containing protein [Hyphomonadaceae bacterium]
MTRRSGHERDRWDSDDWDNRGEIYEEHVYGGAGGRKRFRRNRIDGVVGGVCAGLGDYFGIDPIIIRVITVASIFFSSGFTLLLYILLWVFVPSDKRAPYRRERREALRARRRNRHRDEEPARSFRTTTFRDVKSKYRSLETRLQDLERSITSSEWKLRRQFRDLEN